MVPSAADVDSLISKVARVTGSVTTKDVLVVNLTPLPRYQGSCCVVSKAILIISLTYYDLFCYFSFGARKLR